MKCEKCKEEPATVTLEHRAPGSKQWRPHLAAENGRRLRRCVWCAAKATESLMSPWCVVR